MFQRQPEDKNYRMKTESVITDGNKCVKFLIEKYTGASLTEELVERIAMEAFVEGRTAGKATAVVVDLASRRPVFLR